MTEAASNRGDESQTDHASTPERPIARFDGSLLLEILSGGITGLALLGSTAVLESVRRNWLPDADLAVVVVLRLLDATLILGAAAKVLQAFGRILKEAHNLWAELARVRKDRQFGRLTWLAVKRATRTDVPAFFKAGALCTILLLAFVGFSFIASRHTAVVVVLGIFVGVFIILVTIMAFKSDAEARALGASFAGAVFIVGLFLIVAVLIGLVTTLLYLVVGGPGAVFSFFHSLFTAN